MDEKVQPQLFFVKREGKLEGLRKSV